MFRPFSLKTVEVSDQVLGRGTYSDVFRGVLRTTQTPVAVKVIKEKHMIDRNLWQQEIDLLKKLNHVNIVRLYDYESAFLVRVPLHCSFCFCIIFPLYCFGS